MKKINTLLIVLMALLSLSILSLVSTRFVKNTDPFNFNFNFNFGRRETTLLVSESLDASEIQSIMINAYSLDITFIQGTSDDIVVNHYGGTDFSPVTITHDQGILTVSQPSERNIGFSWGSWNQRLEVTLPSKAYDTVSITTVSGNITIPALTATNTALNTTSGDLFINSLVSNAIDVSVTSGDISMNNTEGALKVRSTSGDLDLVNLIGSVNLQLTSGDVEIEGFTMTQDSSIESLSGDVDIVFNRDQTPIRVDASALSGDIENHFGSQTQDNPLNLRIRTTSGDVELR
ncbi:hypothetical protein AOC36_07465 [Erysipelothrix larvae]|uniref:DUF4097 domain-containing protein n=1 Tax=Erysipelothrix larvae TaxID=1514105 RepID=A0A120JTS6_9FIRM|nr:DUF4097 family beta strand repeat-containing protein [Erysipelothrix larvae]AMC93827.1 hypothetical protein AOC36_07465 [Erysipelothrix larvae]